MGAYSKMSTIIEQIKAVFQDATKTKGRNLLFMLVEVGLIILILAGVIVGLILAASSQDNSGTTVTSASVSSAIASSSMAAVSSTTSSETQSKTMVDITSQVESGKNKHTSKGPDMTPITQWSDDRFLPKLPEPANRLDYFETSKLTNDELLLFTSLKGIVNKTQPRIYSATSDPKSSYNEWIDKLNIKLNYCDNPYRLIDKYKREISGIVIYDDTDKRVSSTVNLATTIAGTKSALICSPALATVIQKYYKKEFTSRRWKVIDNLKKHGFRDKWEIYEYMFDEYLPGTSDRVICGLNPEGVYGNMRDYAIAIGANVIYLDPQAPADSEILHKYLSRMPAGKSTFMGWWTQENDGVNFASSYGIITLASDWSTNLSVYSGMNKGYSIPKQTTKAPPKLENKVYVGMMVADGDNLQYMEGYFFNLWNQPERGQMPISWTMTPSLVDIGKPLLSYYSKTKSANDYFICGPSAYGYFYPKFWTVNNTSEKVSKTFAPFLQLSNKYFEKLGWRAITVWNWDSGAMKKDLMQVYADNMPVLLGFSQQENMDQREVILKSKASKKEMLCIKLDGSYCGEMRQLKDIGNAKISTYYANNARKPEFVTLQAVPWSVGNSINNLLEVKKSFEMQCADVEFVTMDQMYQLMLQYQRQIQ